MELEPGIDVIRTARLELVPLTTSFRDALLSCDLEVASDEIGAHVGPWLVNDPSHVTRLHLAEGAAQADGFPGVGRLIVLATGTGARRVIGSIGFHGPPDDRERLEVSCRIHPAHRGHGFAIEALAGLLDWATERFGVQRFVVAIPSGHEPWDPVPMEIDDGRTEQLDRRADGLDQLLEGRSGQP
jgi:ribosomal-protein-alanine N-acetyltransferase